MICKNCGKKPEEIQEYIEAAAEYGGISPAEYVRREEGTYNRDSQLFYCTECYIAIGMPLGTA